ncbi:MAG: iron-sulfur cluster assembly scaffold protein [Desulfomonilaceae bacterium]|nr:iron-sulfur cluster assembly scaffold protein [Desulfomonilaceae bacterium]
MDRNSLQEAPVAVPIRPVKGVSREAAAERRKGLSTMKQGNDVFDDIEGLTLLEAKKVYSERVIELFTNPRNLGALENADAYTYMSGICGDTVGMFVGLENGRIGRIGFVTNGCGPTIACSSALTCMAEGRLVEEAMALTSQDLIAFLGGLPIEHTHCADLAVNTLRGALEKLEIGKAAAS